MIPSTSISLSSRAPGPAVQSVAGRVFVIGPGYGLPLNTPKTINRKDELAGAGGPLASLVAEVLVEAQTNRKESGLPVYAVRSATTIPSALGAVAKQPASGAVSFSVFGAVKLAGADANGDIMFYALTAGAALTVETGGALAVTVNGAAVVLTIPTATAASAVETYWNGQAAAAAVFAIDAQGTGASNAGTTLATTPADNGTLTFTAPDAGYSVRVIVSGNNTALSAAYSGTGNKDLTVNLATDADGTPTSTAAQVVALPAISGGAVTVAAGGTGAGLAGALGSYTPLTFGSSAAATASGTPTDRFLVQVECTRAGALGAATVRFAVDEPNPADATYFGQGTARFYLLAKRAGLRVTLAQQTGNSKALGHSLIGGALTVNLGTGSTGSPNTTAAALRTYLLAQPRVAAALRVELVGDGTGIVGAESELRLEAPALNWSGDLLVPAGGARALVTSDLTTGITLTFSGTLEEGDLFVVESTLPQSSVADMRTALAAAVSDTIRQGGLVVFASPSDRAGAASLDTDMQAALQTRQLVGIFPSRGIGEGVIGETEQQWLDAVTTDFLGYVSVRGLLSRADGECLTVDALTGRYMRRYAVWPAASRAAACPYHQSLGRTLEIPGSGSCKRVLGLYHNEDRLPGLHDQRGITLRTADERPGAYFITASPTLADVSDTGYAYLEYARTLLVGLRIAKTLAFDLRNTNYAVIPQPDQTGAPAGALTVTASASMESYLGAGVGAEWERKKSDNEASVSPLAEGEQYVTVLRDNNFAAGPEARTVKFTVGCRVKPAAEFIQITGEVVLPG